MSLFVTGSVALAYTVGVVGIHRWSVWRRRQRAQGYPALDWLDWDTLLSGLSKPTEAARRAVTPREGGPAPRSLSADSPDVLSALVSGSPVGSEALSAAGFHGSEHAWLSSLAARVTKPEAVLEALEAHPVSSVGEVYLREWLTLRHAVTPLSVEWQVYASKRRLGDAMRRFGDAPALYFVRAKASSLLGFSQSVLDDVGRAVFFSREAPFYVEAVVSMPFVQELRPPLFRACADAAARHAEGD